MTELTITGVIKKRRCMAPLSSVDRDSSSKVILVVKCNILSYLEQIQKGYICLFQVHQN